MAITAVISLNPSSTNPKRVSTVSCAISNSGASDVDVLGIRPLGTPSGSTKESVSLNFGNPPTGPNQDVTVPAGGSLTMSWGVVAFTPQPNGVVSVYDIGAVISCDDGSEVEATTAELTVTGNAEASED